MSRECSSRMTKPIVPCLVQMSQEELIEHLKRRVYVMSREELEQFYISTYVKKTMQRKRTKMVHRKAA
jgi:hypothetical protein